MADSDIVVSGLQASVITRDSITLQWSIDDPNVQGLSYLRLGAVEIWASTINDRGESIINLIGETTSTTFTHADLDPDTTWFYWIIPRNVAGYYGDWHPISPTGGLEATTLNWSATQEITFYVRSDGDDDNNGLTNTAGGAFRSIQRAADVVVGLDPSYVATIQVVGPAEYEPVLLRKYISVGRHKLIGDTTTPSNVEIVNQASSDVYCILLEGPGLWDIGGFKLSAHPGAQALLKASEGATINVKYKMEYGDAGGGYHILAIANANVVIDEDYTISGDAVVHMFADLKSFVGDNGNGTVAVTVSGTPDFTSFAWAQLGSVIRANSCTFTGSATGRRYDVFDTSTIFTNGGANFFPGDAAGVAHQNGVYF